MIRAHHRKSPWRQMLRQGFKIVCTLLTITFAVGLVIVGRDVLADRAEQAETPQDTAPIYVSTARLTVENGYAIERHFPGQIQAAQRTDMAFEQGGTIARIFVDEGDAITPGSVIAQLDTRLIEAEKSRLTAARRALDAQAELARRTAERQTELKTRGFASKQAVDNIALRLVELEARIAEVDADLVSIDLQLEKSQVFAPFSATVSTRLMDTGGTVSAGQPVVSLVETGGHQFRAGLPPRMITALTPDTEYRAVFDGHVYPVKLHSVLPELDSATRTRTVLFDFLGRELPPLRDTGVLVLEDRVAETGAWVPLSALQDAPRGLWQLMTLSGTITPVVETEAVEVLFSDAQRAYVRGTFLSDALFITQGPHRVVKGQTVRTSEAGS